MQLAEASTSQPSVAPGDLEVNKVARTASRKLKELLEQEQYEEVYSGALDGLSGSDIVPAVEELENVFSSLYRLFTETLPSLAGSIFRAGDVSSAVVGSSGLTQGWLSGSLDLAQLARPQQTPSAAPALDSSARSSQRVSAERGSDLPTSFMTDADRIVAGGLRPEVLEVAMRLSSGLFQADIGFTAAATNAVTAAVNVNNQVENMLGPLRQAAADMRSIVSQIADLAASIDKYESAAQVDRESLARSAEALHNILGTATESVSRSGSGLPGLIAQLQTAVAQLRDANSSAARADAVKFEKVVKTLEAAVGALTDASVSLDVKEPLQAAKEQVDEEIKGEQMPAELEPVAEKAERAVDPAVQGIEKAVNRLQDALTDLDTAVSAARGFRADAAPPLKN